MKGLSFLFSIKTLLLLLALVLSVFSQEDTTPEGPSQFIFIRTSLSFAFTTPESPKIGLGPSIEFGTTFKKHLFGINGIFNLKKKSNTRFFIAGGGLNWQYRFIIHPSALEFSPGVTAGFWRKDTNKYYSLGGGKDWYRSRDFLFGGAKAQMKMGYKHFFLICEEMILFGTDYLNIFNFGFEFDI